MKNILIDNENEVKYVVIVGGVEVSPRYTTQQAADAAIEHLSEAQQNIAEVVTVTSNGDQLLLG